MGYSERKKFAPKGRKEIVFKGSKYFPIRITHSEKGDKYFQVKVISHGDISIQFKNIHLNTEFIQSMMIAEAAWLMLVSISQIQQGTIGLLTRELSLTSSPENRTIKSIKVALGNKEHITE